MERVQGFIFISHTIAIILLLSENRVFSLSSTFNLLFIVNHSQNIMRLSQRHKMKKNKSLCAGIQQAVNQARI